MSAVLGLMLVIIPHFISGKLFKTCADPSKILTMPKLGPSLDTQVAWFVSPVPFRFSIKK
jgi:hypothetical protein